MANKYYSMNETLKFSWGHIIAFLALIFISYVTFVGLTYLTDGDFVIASIGFILCDALLLVFFIGAQMAKATDRKFAKRIVWERIFIFGSPIIFVLCMLPFYHFGTVHTKDDEIVADFTNAITASKQMFADYDDYSNKRIANYEHMLNRVISNRSIHPGEFISCGFADGKEEIQRDNMVETLRLQLLSENYDSLKNAALEWIESSNQGASTWNIFLLGNTKEIKNAIHYWNIQLAGFARHKMNNEEFNGYNTVETFTGTSASLASVDAGLDGLTNKFKETAFPPIGFIIGSIFLYIALLFPYYLQDRHTKSLYRLVGMENDKRTIFPTKSKKKKSPENEMEIETYEEENESSDSKNKSDDDDDDYKTFTL